MFSIYDPDGLRFRGPLEALEQQRVVRRRAPVAPLAEGRRTAPYPPGSGAREAAAEAYRRTAARENMIEPLVAISQIMTSPALTIDAQERVSVAWRRLTEHGVRQLVVPSDRQGVAWMVSDRDILRRITIIGDAAEIERDVAIAEMMQRETLTTDAGSDIRRVAKVMAYYHVDALPVIGGGDRLVGIVTRGDILRGFAENPRLNLWG